MVNLDSSYYRSFRANCHEMATIRETLVEFALKHFKLEDIEAKALELIKQAGGEPAFKKVPGYHWATCISVNDAIVHGIPKGYLEPGDVVTIDTGMFRDGTTSDTATSFVVGQSSKEKDHFLAVGRETLKKTAATIKPGVKVRDLASCMQTSIEKEGWNVTRNLTGHGLGNSMHEPPMIPCFISSDPSLNTVLKPGMILAIEVMYMMGDWPLKTDRDGWTMRTADGSLSAVFEDDILVTDTGFELLTQ